MSSRERERDINDLLSCSLSALQGHAAEDGAGAEPPGDAAGQVVRMLSVLPL